MEQPDRASVTPPRTGKPAGRREQVKAQNRKIILDAARSVFADIGYGAATVRDIIRATPLASGTFYNYFQSKEEVFQAIRDDAALRIRPRLREARAGADTLETFISRTYRTYFDYMVEDQAAHGRVAGADSMRVRMDTPEILAGFEELRQDIIAGVGRGLFPSVNPDYLMAAMVGVAFEIAEEMLKRTPPDPQGATEFATALFIGGIHRLPAG